MFSIGIFVKIYNNIWSDKCNMKASNSDMKEEGFVIKTQFFKYLNYKNT